MDTPDDVWRAPLAARLKALRQLRGLTLREVSERAKLSSRFLSDLENQRGNPSVASLYVIAEALGVAPWSLLLPGAFEGMRDDALATLASAPRAVMHQVAHLLQTSRPRPVALLGLRGAGKSTVGPALARALSRRFVEVDAQVQSVASMSIGAVFELHGEAHYRKLERDALRELCEAADAPVLAVSGGVVTDEQTRALLFSQCHTVWLKASPQRHWDRVVAQGDERPMDGRTRARGELEELYARRAPFYAEADVIIETDDHAVPGVCSLIVEALAALNTRTAAASSD